MFYHCKRAKEKDPQSNGLEIKYLMRALNPTHGGLRIGLSSKSVEKCFLDFMNEHFVNDNKTKNEIIYEFERDIFGYQLNSEGKRPNFNLPFKAMIGRPFKSS